MSNDFGDNYEKRERYDYTTDPYRDERKKGCSCWTGCGCGCLVLVLVFVIGGFLFYNICVKGVPLKVMPETTVLTEPLKSDGKTVDYFPVIAELVEPKVPAEDNAFKAVLQAYGKAMFEARHGVTRDWQYEETCKHFGLDPTSLKPTCVYEDAPDVFVPKTPPVADKPKPEAEKPEAAEVESAPDEDETDEAHTRIDEYVSLAETPWTVEERPEMKEWLEKVGPGLDVVQQAGLKDHYFFPMVRRNDKEVCMITISQDLFRFHIHLSQGLRVRAMNRLATGDTDGAWKDLLAAFRIYRQTLAGADALSEMEGEFIEITLNPTLVETVLRHPGWTPESLGKAIADLESLPNWPDTMDYVKASRFLFLDVVSSTGDMRSLLESVSTEPIDGDTARAIGMVGFNWNIVAKKANERFDELEANLHGKTFEEIRSAFDEDPQEQLETEMRTRFSNPADAMFKLVTVGGRSDLLGDVLARMLALYTGRIIVEGIDEEIHCRLLHAGLALEKYKLEKKEYPDSLDVLGLKEFEPTLPIKYEKTDTGYKLSAEEIEIERGLPSPPDPAKASDDQTK